MIHDKKQGELFAMTPQEVFGRRAQVTGGLNGHWRLADQDVTEQVDWLFLNGWVRIHHFCGGSCLRALPVKKRTRTSEMPCAS